MSYAGVSLVLQSLLLCQTEWSPAHACPVLHPLRGPLPPPPPHPCAPNLVVGCRHAAELVSWHKPCASQGPYQALGLCLNRSHLCQVCCQKKLCCRCVGGADMQQSLLVRLQNLCQLETLLAHCLTLLPAHPDPLPPLIPQLLTSTTQSKPPVRLLFATVAKKGLQDSCLCHVAMPLCL